MFEFLAFTCMCESAGVFGTFWKSCCLSSLRPHEQVTALINKKADAHIPNYSSLPTQLICQLQNVSMHACNCRNKCNTYSNDITATESVKGKGCIFTT